MRNAVRLFLTSARLSFADFSAEYSPVTFLSLAVPRYILQTLFFVLVAYAAGGSEMMKYALIGNAVQIAANMAQINMAITANREKWTGTILYLIAVPSNILPALLGSSAAPMFQGAISTLIAFAAVIPMVGATGLGRIWLAAPIIALIVFSVSALGLLVGSATLRTRVTVLVANALAYIMMIVCGVNFPLAALPRWLQVAAHFLPMTNGLLAVRAVVEGSAYTDILSLISLEVLIGLVYGALGYLVFTLQLDWARRDGKIELF